MIGQQIANYTVTAHLGQGGMGNVFRATDNMLGREVALKMLHPQLTVQPQFLERFKKEARILAQLLHPNIAVIYNFFESQNDHFMVMEYVEGVSVDDLLKKYQTLPASLVVAITIQALEGLQHAHRKHIFHRDIKPANLMITNEDVVKLMDFGIAKVSGEQKLTQVNKIVGTIEFMAPELIEGKEASASSDLYSMGATMYEMLSGKIPFEADTDFNLMQSILKSKPIAPEKLNTYIPKALSDIVLKAMDKDPNKRFPDARAFQSALLAAFPLYREVDLRHLSQAGLMETRVAGLEAETRMASGVSQGKWASIVSTSTRKIQYFKQQLVTKRKWALILAGLLLLMLLSYFLLKTDEKKQDQIVSKSDSAESKTASTKPGRNPYETPLENSGGSSLPAGPSRPVNSGGYEGSGAKPVGPVTEEKQKPVETQGRKKSSISLIEEPVKKETSKVDDVDEPKQPKSVSISSGTKINLRLVSRIDMDQEKKSDQVAKFVVTRSVSQGGVVVIREGATATGTITVGRVMTDISINQVETVTGKRISVKAEKAHGKRTDLENGTSFTAVVLPGAVVNF